MANDNRIEIVASLDYKVSEASIIRDLQKIQNSFNNAGGLKIGCTINTDSLKAIQTQISNIASNLNINVGAITAPKHSDLDKNFLSKSFSKQGLNISDNQLQNPGIYSKGNQLNAFKDIAKKRNDDPLIMDKYAHRATNAIVQNHELNEYKYLGSGSKLPQTQLGLTYGHHSLGKILGNERNIIITGDKRIKHAGQNFENARTGSGEFDYMKMIAPKNKNGEDMIPSYTDGPRLNRRHLRALYSKELGLPAGASRKDIHNVNKNFNAQKRDFINQED